MLKKILILLVFVVIGFYSHAQVLTPIKWSYASKKIDNKQAMLFVKANLDKGWHIYSQQATGPIKTRFNFIKDGGYSLVGKITEPMPISKFEPLLNQTLQYFEQSVVFQQKIKLKSTKAVVKGTVNFLVCNDKHCLPPDEVNFTIPVK
ncbi:protein-disulfide reductase DsbD domain-containing protein [Mucilaginibacter sp. CAU 1740]|uniref:protein-disulfide reductase DsbD domain-containing protein n=1 Tax=Mucilaginibacter sp. CAU 1740 TaxID=3140365 RepID=UPI00325A86AC